MTEPLLPAEVDLRGIPYMPLDTVRLADSDLSAVATGDEFKAAVLLWCKSWYQVPAGSLPNDDRVLARLSGAESKWKKVKEVALKGFVLCTDGRLYHPLIAEKALAAWQFRQKQRANIKKRWSGNGHGGSSMEDTMVDTVVDTVEHTVVQPRNYHGSTKLIPKEVEVEVEVKEPKELPSSQEVPLLVVPDGTTIPKAGSESKGTRLPCDWVLTSEQEEFARRARPHWSPANIQFVAESFRDYWLSKAGKDARRVDWALTWNNWVRNQDERKIPPDSPSVLTRPWH